MFEPDYMGDGLQVDQSMPCIASWSWLLSGVIVFFVLESLSLSPRVCVCFSKKKKKKKASWSIKEVWAASKALTTLSITFH